MGMNQENIMGDWNNNLRRVTVSSFRIDQYEVSNKQYRNYIKWLERVFIPLGKDSIVKALNINKFVVKKMFITEPLWPAPKFGSKASLASPGSLIFSVAKIFDIALSKVSKYYGTRFFLLAKPEI